MVQRVYIFTGHYGSGKTEVAINFAFYLKRLHPQRKVAIADLDIVNPFFRTADAKESLEQAGIQVVLPLYANTNVDVPALTPQMAGLIEDTECDVVLDIGGDDLGAKAVGRYREELEKRGYLLYFVLNPNRPFTHDLPLACRMFEEIQDAAALRITGIVNNANLLQDTTTQTIRQALPLVRQLADAKQVPVLLHTVFQPVAEELLVQAAQHANELEEAIALPADLHLEGLPDWEGAPLLSMTENVRLLWDRRDE